MQLLGGLVGGIVVGGLVVGGLVVGGLVVVGSLVGVLVESCGAELPSQRCSPSRARLHLTGQSFMTLMNLQSFADQPLQPGLSLK